MTDRLDVDTVTPGLADHEWPAPGEHLWSDWSLRDPMPKPTKARHCLHPACSAVQVRKVPITPMRVDR